MAMMFTIFKIISATLLISLRISCHGKHHDKSPKVEILKYPPSIIKVLTGSTIDLHWRYRVEPIERLQITSWYYGTVVENRLSIDQIIRKNHSGDGAIKVNPFLTKDKNIRTSCDFSLVGQIGAMYCRITNVNVQDSAVYGIKLQVENIKVPILNETSVEVVDIFLNQHESDSALQSWIGRETELNCAIFKIAKLEIKYEWSVVTEAKDITRGITRSPNKTSYTFVPLSRKDFGLYRCTISTTSTLVEHTIILQQIDYPEAPELQKLLPQGTGDIRLYWKRPSSNGGSRIIDYVVETRINENKKWIYIGSTSKLSTTVTDFKNPNRYQIRVCSRNKIGIGPTSCSEVKKVQIPVGLKRTSGCASIIPFKYLWILFLFLSTI